MNTSQIYKGLLAAAIMAFATVSCQQAQAAVGCKKGSVCCPKCQHSCTLKVEKVDVEKTCFEVESKTICIPRVVFPWQMPKKKQGCGSCDGLGCSTCVNNGATTRTVRILKNKKYKCPECKYSWSAKDASSCNGGSGGCSGGCSGCDASYALAPYAELGPVSTGMPPIPTPAPPANANANANAPAPAPAPAPMAPPSTSSAYPSPVYIAPDPSQPSASYESPTPYYQPAPYQPSAASQGSGTK